jgi:hypothetical protein
MTLRSLNAIGFACRSRQDLAVTLAAMSAKQTETIITDTGIVRHWRGVSGAEIIFRYTSPPRDRRADDAVNALTDLVGLSAFHQGQGAITVTCLASVALGSSDPMAGVWHVALAPDHHTGQAPELLVEMVPFEPLVVTSDAQAPRTLQIVGFCTRLEYFKDLADYLQTMPRKLLCPPGSILATAAGPTLRRRVGTLGQSAAMITGVVQQVRRLTNPVTGNGYHWLLVATERGEVDLLAASIGEENGPSIGSLICAHADLVARATQRQVMPCTMPAFVPKTPTDQAVQALDGILLQLPRQRVSAA